MRISKKESVNHHIVRGSLMVNKVFFTKESMKAGSYLRILLGLEESYCKKVTNIKRQGDELIISYGCGELVYVPDDVHRFIKKVKEAYGKELKGSIDISIAYGPINFTELRIDF